MKNLTTFSAMSMSCLVASLLLGCTVHTSDRKHEDGKKVAIDTPLGGLKVRTDDVEAKDAGLSVYPGARPKVAEDNDDKKANVNIDTPWFGLKVVALQYEADDAPEKVWDYYKKELARYGRVLECKPGSPDMDIQKQDKDDLTCSDDKRGKQIRVSSAKGMQLKAGTQGKQHIVAVKPSGKGTEFSLVYVNAREGRETL